MAPPMCMAVVFLMAFTVGQANQYSAGSECPSDINSNNVASLLDTKPQTGALNEGGEENHCSSRGECPSDNSLEHLVVMLQTNLQMHMLEVGSEAPTTKAPMAEANDVIRISSMHGPSSANPHNSISRPTNLAVTFVTVTDKSFETNLGTSLLWKQRDTLPHEWLVIKNEKGAGIGELYAQAQRIAQHPLVVFVHPDVTLPDDFYANFRLKLAKLEAVDPNWGVLGVAGVPLLWNSNIRGIPKIATSITDCNITSTTGRDNLPVQSLDEQLLVLRAGSPKFDSNLPGFDLYGTDIVLSARQAGLKSYLLNINVKHKNKDADGKPVKVEEWLRKVYQPEYQIRASATNVYMQKKWCASKFLPVYGTFYTVPNFNCEAYSKQ